MDPRLLVISLLVAILALGACFTGDLLMILSRDHSLSLPLPSEIAVPCKQHRIRGGI